MRKRGNDVDVTIADSLFLQYAHSAKMGGPNKGNHPTHFHWKSTCGEKARFVTDSELKYSSGLGQIAFLLETFFLHPENYFTALEKPFDHVLTHNRYFARHKNWLWYPHGGSWVAFNDWRVYPKTKGISILLSSKRTLKGHKLFHEAVETYRDRFDGIFGLDRYASKLEALAPFRYAVIIEAEKSDSFFSEKLIDCLAVGTIPIYWGCPNIADFFDPLGILHVDTLGQIGEMMEVATPPLYTYRLKHVRENLELAREYAIPEDWIFEHYPFLFGEEI